MKLGIFKKKPKIETSERSWADDEATLRVYKAKSGGYILVLNEFQRVACPHCGKHQYARFTHINKGAPADLSPYQEAHVNYNEEIDYLRVLLVSYAKGGAPVVERQINGMWCLCSGDEILGTYATEQSKKMCEMILGRPNG